MTVVTDAGLALLVKLQPNLRRLVLGETHVLTHTGYAHLKKLTRLRDLRVNAQTLDDRAAKVIATLPLRRLSMRNTRITDAVLPHFTGMQQLEHLDLFGARGLTDTGVAHLAAIDTLKSLNVSGARGVSDRTIRELAKLPLESIDLSSFGCAKNPMSAKYTDEGLRVLAAMPTLRRIVIRGAPLVSTKTVEALRKADPKREVLYRRTD